MPRTHVVPIEDSNASRQHDLHIKLPDGYSEGTDKKYRPHACETFRFAVTSRTRFHVYCWRVRSIHSSTVFT